MCETATSTAEPSREAFMASYTWACFECRRTVRRAVPKNGEVQCSTCGRPCRYVGTRIRVPAREKKAAWEELRDSLRAAKLKEDLRREHARVRRRHELEKRVADLESKPANPSRSRQIRELKEQLAGL
jgi:uncharacterized Zn finger protein (UPF0148 family)